MAFGSPEGSRPYRSGTFCFSPSGSHHSTSRAQTSSSCLYPLPCLLQSEQSSLCHHSVFIKVFLFAPYLQLIPSLFSMRRSCLCLPAQGAMSLSAAPASSSHAQTPEALGAASPSPWHSGPVSKHKHTQWGRL